jgi:hypothetical protein
LKNTLDIYLIDDEKGKLYFIYCFNNNINNLGDKYYLLIFDKNKKVILNFYQIDNIMKELDKLKLETKHSLLKLGIHSKTYDYSLNLLNELDNYKFMNLNNKEYFLDFIKHAPQAYKEILKEKEENKIYSFTEKSKNEPKK